MNISEDILTLGEKTVFALRRLYKDYGYTQFKMSKFEEYDLYASNKNFLVSDNVITFNDTDGKLMALKPDVTLSIVRNSRPENGGVEKVFYDENVYRVSKGTHAYKEIMQAGLECIGDIDTVCISEVLTLAAKSLEMISDDYVLEISHAGIIAEVLNAMELPERAHNEVIKCVGEKNIHGLSEICAANGVSSEKLIKLMKLNGSPDSVAAVLESEFAGEASDSLCAAVKALCEEVSESKIKIDFSVVNDMNYYNGIVFKGYVSGIPTGVLSGGQYGSLVRKMGKSCEAIGFAVYLDELENLARNDIEKKYDVDTLIIYKDPSGDVQKLTRMLRASGASVAVAKKAPEKLRYKEIVYADGGKSNG